MQRPFLLLIAASALAVANGQTPTPGSQPAAQPQREPGLYTTIETSMGSIVVRLFEKEVPITVKNFVDLAMGRKAWPNPKTGQPVRKPLYNGLTFHRVIPDFMIQGGDPLGNGMGGTTPIKDEFNPTLKFDQPGRLAMANTGRPGTGSSQFFITDGLTAWLNMKHTIFGQVVEGQDVVAKIARVPADRNNKPLTPVRMVRVTFKREGPAPENDVLGPRRPAARKPSSGAKPAQRPKAAPAKKVPAEKKPATNTSEASKPAIGRSTAPDK